MTDKPIPHGIAEAVYEAAKTVRRWAMREIIEDISLFGEMQDEAMFDLCAQLEEVFPGIVEEIEREDDLDNAIH